MVVGPDRALIYANEPVLRRLGQPLNDLIGRPCFQVFQSNQIGCLPSGQDCPIAAAVETGKPATVTQNATDATCPLPCAGREVLPLQHADGQVLAVLCLAVEEPSAEPGLYRRIFTTMRDGVAVLTRDGRFVEANSAFCEMLGYRRDELTKLAVTSLLPPKLARALRGSARRGIPFIELSLARKDGSALMAEAAVSLMPVARGALYVATVRDITCRKEREDFISEQAQELALYRIMFEAAGDPMMVVEDDTTLVAVNRRFEEMTGYRRHEVEGRMCLADFVPEENREQALAIHRLRRSRPSEVMPHHHNWVTTKTGERWLASVTGAMIPGTLRSIIAMRDQTDTIRIQEQALGRNRELEALYSVASLVSRSTDLDCMLNEVMEKVLEITGQSRALVYLLDESERKLTIRAHKTAPNSLLMAVDNLAMGEGFGGWVAQNAEPVFVPDITKDPRLTRHSAAREGFRALACVPLVSGRKILGVMTVSGSEVREFGPEEQRLLISIGHEVGVAIERARFLQKAQDRARELGTISFVTRQLASTLDLQAVLDRTLVIMCMQVGADHGGVALLDPVSGDLVARSLWGDNFLPMRTAWKKGQGVSGWVAQHGAQFVTGDIAADSRVVDCYGPELGYRSMVGVPLKVKDKFLGTVVVANRKKDAFTGDHIRLLSAYASQAALAIENALLYDSARTEASNLAEALKRLSTSEHRFNTLTATIPNGLLERDKAGRLIRVNQALADMLEYSLEELLDTDLGVFLAPSSAEKVRAETAKRFEGISSTYEAELVTRDGRLVPVLASGAPLRDHDGNITGIFAVITDLREIKRLQQERSRAERLASIGQMATVVAHEVRNPLGAIGNSLYYLKMRLEGTDVDSKVLRHLEIISKAVASASHITDELLDFARPKTPVLQPCSLRFIVHEAIAQVAFPQDVVLTTEMHSELPLISADPEMLKQVFSNLLLNAIQAIPEGGGVVTVKTRTDGSFQEVQVIDTGNGIEAELIDQLFQPFLTTKPRGVGLGLYASKEIIEKHGGTLELRSQPGEGTTAVVSLPVAGREGSTADGWQSMHSGRG